jgi:hypothetical protein
MLATMRAAIALLVLAFIAGGATAGVAAEARLVKVLPHLLDREGRHTLSPSLFERDAYQERLRRQPAQRSGLRLDVQWKARAAGPWLLRVELRGSRDGQATTATVEQTVKPRGLFSTWSRLPFTGDAYRSFGELSAWRATLWQGEKMISEQKSFLW